MQAILNLNVKRLREKLNLSQEVFAHRLGVSLFTVYRWETGKASPSTLARRELSLFLYNQKLIPMGRARQISGLSKAEFLNLLGERNIPRHYTENDLEEDSIFLKKWK